MKGLLMKGKEDKDKKITFFSKEAVRCPVCGAAFHREELFSGRVNAGDLTDELHRQYIPMRDFGEVHPLAYDVTVCPSCFYAALRSDFSAAPQKALDVLEGETSSRIAQVQKVFEGLDFQGSRRILEGAASYYLAVLCYEHFPKDFSPTLKGAMCCLRAAWLCGHLHEKAPNENFDYLALVFYRKARILYRGAIEREQSGKEPIGGARWMGPDTDKNYGYEGALYLSGVLELKYGNRGDTAYREKILDESKRTIAKMFGLGKRSKAKPGPLLDKARDLYDRIKAELHQDDDSDDE